MIDLLINIQFYLSYNYYLFVILGGIIFSRRTSGPDLLAALMGNVLLGLIIFTVKKVHLDFTV